jgi:putative nucleotidyltransferase with HDIG domain
MIYRVKQFIKGLTAHVDDNNILINNNLNLLEKELFLRLPHHEKLHAVNTAYTIKKLCGDINCDVLVKAALLHDIGKVNGKIGIIKKSVLVLMNRFLPKISYLLSSKLKMFYIYYNHPEIGAKLLRKANTDEQVIKLVEYHQSDDIHKIDGMVLLRKADSLN